MALKHEALGMCNAKTNDVCLSKVFCFNSPYLPQNSAHQTFECVRLLGGI